MIITKNVLEGKTILVIDDDPSIRRLVAHLLIKAGIRVMEAESGADAKLRLSQASFDAILLDVKLPDIDGYSLCRGIVHDTPKTPVLIITALTDAESLRRGFEAGAADFIKKPLSRIELLARLQNSVRLRDSEARYDALYQSLLDDLETAAKVQSLSLPRNLMVEDGVIFSSLYRPSLQVGGDLFDIHPLGGGRFVVYIADISGHGIHSALLMSAVKAYLKLIIESRSVSNDPHAILNQLNRTLDDRLMRDKYLTALLGILDVPGRTFTFLNAGHPPALLYDDRKGKAETIGQDLGSIPIGWKKGRIYRPEEEQTIELSESSVLLLGTDGIFEAVDPDGQQLGQDGFTEMVERLAAEPTPALPSLLCRDLETRKYDLSHDDLTMLAVRLASPSGITLTVRPSLDLVSISLEQIERIIREATQDAGLAARVELASAEILNNIVRHSGIESEGNPILVQIEPASGPRLRFYDFGKAWSLKTVPTVDALLPDQVGGRGLAIIGELAAELSLRRIGTLNELDIRIKPEARP